MPTTSLDNLSLPLKSDGQVDGRSARKVETRRRIIAAASELFAERGYAGTSMEEIAESAGVSKGTIFYNFRTKSDLFEQLVMLAASDMGDGMLQAREGLQGWEALSAMLRHVIEAADRSPAQAQILLTELFRENRAWAATLHEARERMLSPLTDMLDELGRAREEITGQRLLQRDQADVVAIAMMGAMVVGTLDRHAYSTRMTLDQLHATLMQSVSRMRTEDLTPADGQQG